MSSLRELLVHHRDFRRLFLASVVSMAGDWFAFIAVADLVTRETGRPGAAAFVFAATVLPVFLASPIVGMVADRYDRRTIMVIANLCRVPVALLLCVAAWSGSVPLAFVAVIALAVGASFYDPIAAAATPNLVPPHQLVQAQALMGAIWGAMVFVGAGLGGVVAEALGNQVAFVTNAATFAISAGLVWAVRTPMQQAGSQDRTSTGRAQLAEAIGYIRRDPLVRRFVLAKLGVGVANGTVGLLPALALVKFAGTSIATGLLFSARGLGALLGPLLARRIAGAAPGPRGAIVICGIATLLYAVSYAVLPGIPWFGAAFVLVVVAHLGGGSQWTVAVYALQVATPDRFRGRVLAFDYGLVTLMMGGSSIAAGVLADAVGWGVAMFGLAIAGATYGVIWLTWSLAGARSTWHVDDPPASDEPVRDRAAG